MEVPHVGIIKVSNLLFRGHKSAIQLNAYNKFAVSLLHIE